MAKKIYNMKIYKKVMMRLLYMHVIKHDFKDIFSRVFLRHCEGLMRVELSK